MDCRLEDVWHAQSGGVVLDARMLAPPFAPLAGPPPPGGEKETYGGDLPYHVDSANFTVQWEAAEIDEAQAALISTTLESAWTTLVEEHGWPLPASADVYRVWVILDPGLNGSGWTTTYTSPEYPGGYPVLFVNPTYEPDTPEFALSVAVHEFGHALQYALRAWSPSQREAWFWEASAEWMAELGGPDFNTYAWSSYWYREHPELSYHSTEQAHQYGMMLLAAYLDEYLVGSEGFRDVWLENDGADWADAIAAVAGIDFPEVVVGMSGAWAAQAFRESDLYYEPRATALDGTFTGTAAGELGTWYFEAPPVRVYGDVRLVTAEGGAWHEGTPDDFGILAVTTNEASGTFSVVPEGAGGNDTGPGEEPGPGCACGSTTPFAAPLLLPLLLLRRRQLPGPASARSTSVTMADS